MSSKIPEISTVDTHSEWINSISFGHLTTPSETWSESWLKMESLFRAVCGDGIPSQSPKLKLSDSLKDNFNQVKQAAELHMRYRLYIRIKSINSELKQDRLQKRKRRKNAHFQAYFGY